MTKNTDSDLSFNPALPALSGHIPFSRPFSLNKMKSGRQDIEITAKKNECAEMAGILKIPSIVDLTASFTLSITENKKFLLSGTLKSHLIRLCSVSLEEFTEELNAEFTFLLEPAIRSAQTRATEPESFQVDLSNVPEDFFDRPECLPVYNRQLNLGEIAFEQLALSLNPWPRKPDAVFSFTESGEEQPLINAEQNKNSPFAVLKNLQKKS